MAANTTSKEDDSDSSNPAHSEINPPGISSSTPAEKAAALTHTNSNNLSNRRNYLREFSGIKTCSKVPKFPMEDKPPP